MFVFNVLLTATVIWRLEPKLKVSNQTDWIRRGLCLGSLVYKAFGLSLNQGGSQLGIQKKYHNEIK